MSSWIRSGQNEFSQMLELIKKEIVPVDYQVINFFLNGLLL